MRQYKKKLQVECGRESLFWESGYQTLVLVLPPTPHVTLSKSLKFSLKFGKEPTPFWTAL